MRAFEIQYRIQRATEFMWQSKSAKEEKTALVFHEHKPTSTWCKHHILYTATSYSLQPAELTILDVVEVDPFQLNVKDLSVGQLMQLLNLGGQGE